MVKLKINGESQDLDGAKGMPLLWVLRDKLQLTGTKFGCGTSHNAAPTQSMLTDSPDAPA